MGFGSRLRSDCAIMRGVDESENHAALRARESQGIDHRAVQLHATSESHAAPGERKARCCAGS